MERIRNIDRAPTSQKRIDRLRTEHQAQAKLAAEIVEARKVLPDVKIGDDIFKKIVEISLAIGVDGHRADLIMMKAARTMAAFHDRRELGDSDSGHDAGRAGGARADTDLDYVRSGIDERHGALRRGHIPRHEWDVWKM